jgi:hypothetical protein
MEKADHLNVCSPEIGVREVRPENREQLIDGESWMVTTKDASTNHLGSQERKKERDSQEKIPQGGKDR